MSTTNGVGGTGSILDQYQFGENREAKGNELGKNEFLELLVAQMNNQNPLEPQENGEFIGQLAQFSTVEGVEKLNSLKPLLFKLLARWLKEPCEELKK